MRHEREWGVMSEPEKKDEGFFLMVCLETYLVRILLGKRFQSKRVSKRGNGLPLVQKLGETTLCNRGQTVLLN